MMGERRMMQEALFYGFIRDLNDAFRRTFVGGAVVVTAGFEALPPEQRKSLLGKVRAFDVFTPDNDPHGEHDFGAVNDGDIRCFWKVDHYDRDMTMHSPDAADPAVTTRVLTVMLGRGILVGQSVTAGPISPASPMRRPAPLIGGVGHTMHPDLRRALRVLLGDGDPEGPVLQSAKGGHFRPNSIVNWFAVLFADLGFDGCSSHSGRRTFITSAARNIHRSGCSLRDVQLLAGHASIETTERYIDGDTIGQRRLIELL